jgi:fructose-1,6-bisphosphatase II
VQDLTVFVLDKPRHQDLLAEIIAAGARISIHTDGDVAGALMAVAPWGNVDVLMGTGGSPEAIIAAAAVKALGGQMLCCLDPQSDKEREAVKQAGLDLNRVLNVDELITSNDVHFAATGITTGALLKGVEFTATGAKTSSMMVRGKTGTMRTIESTHRWERLMEISQIDYQA